MPEELSHVGELEVPQDPTFAQRLWRIERVGWGILLLIVLAAFLGVFGHGWLSNEHWRAPDGRLAVEYQRFERLHTETPLLIHLSPRAAPRDTTWLWLGIDFAESANVESVVPIPVAMHSTPDRVWYGFSPPPTLVVIRYAPERPFRRTGHLGLAAGPVLAFTQFVYP